MDRPPRHPSAAAPRRRGAVTVLVAVVLAVVATACMPPLVDPPTSGRSFGQGPLEAVYDAASAKADCGLTPVQLAAMMMAPTYGEAGGPVPSPMALSRWDNVSVSASNANLFAFKQTSGSYVNAFFSPGIGMWQFDSAGGWPFSAAGAIDSVTSANQAATTMSYRWCNAPDSQKVDEPTRRKYAWGPWFACSSGNPSPCEAIFQSLESGDALDTAFDASVTRYGGMQQRTCNVAGLGDGITCWYVNPALAQGSKGWTGGTYNGTSTGVTPLPKPFYVVESGGKEYRVWLRADTGYDIDITASKPITANARTSLTWASGAGLCDVTGGRGACQGRIAQTPTGPKAADPFGALDSATPGADRTVTAMGWAIDPDTNDPIDVHLYVDGAWGGSVKANQLRPDVGQAVPGYGDAHGFRAVLSGVAPGAHQVCAFGINVGPYGTTNPQLGCASVTVPGDPFGSLDGARPVVAGARVQGWAVDPDTSDPVAVHVYVDGAWAGSTTADGSRPDVGGAYPWAGARHGYDLTVPLGGGTHQVCAFAINVGPNGSRNSPLGCASVTGDGSPVGSFDGAATAPGGISVGGWAFDPDTGDATVQVRVDGGPVVALPTATSRPDVGAAFPGRGDLHGFAGVVPATGGSHQVCATIANEGPTGANRSLGCRTVTVLSGNPFGNVDSVIRSGTTARVRGWSIDPDVPGAVAVHVYVNGAWAGATTASALRPDVGAAYPAWGSEHGIDVEVAIPAGAAQVCVYAINQGAGTTNPLLACRTV